MMLALWHQIRMNSSTLKCLNTSINVACIGTLHGLSFLLETGTPLHQAAKHHPPSRGSCGYLLKACTSYIIETLFSATVQLTILVLSNIFQEESLPSASMKDECDSWRLWLCWGVELFQVENWCWRLCVELKVKYKLTFCRTVSPALSCQILTLGSCISHIQLMISYILQN